MSENLLRLNKALADSGLCARRKADELIFSGQVTVNGQVVVAPGHRVNVTQDCIEVNGKPIETAPMQACYLLLHKPIQVVSTVKDPEDRQTVMDFIPPEFQNRRLYPVGRLDYFSEGLLLLTDDGELANRLAHPRYHLPRYYEVKVRGAVSEQALRNMRQGMQLSEGERLASVDVEANTQEADTVLYMVLRQGVNRQIRRMCQDLNLTILRLVRVGLGFLKMEDLAKGQTRSLTEEEIKKLRHAVGL